MKGGVLEVLLVSAEGLQDAHLLGSSGHYVAIQCGAQSFTSKVTEGEDGKVWWNEKFTCKLSTSEWKEMIELKVAIMEKDKFMKDSSVGKAIVYLSRVLREGTEKGLIELKPAPYNVVLEDGSYKGEIKVGLKFTSNIELQQQTGARCGGPEKQRRSIYRTILDLTIWRIPWPKFLIYKSRSLLAEGEKDK